MANNLSAILRKKSFTGEDVGKILILSLIDSYKQTLSGVRYPQPILPEAKMRHMIRSLSGAENRLVYHRYVGLNDWLMQCQPVALNYKQQAIAAIWRLTSIAKTARAAEQNDRYFESLPVIMTKKQYEDARKKRVDEALRERDGQVYDLFALVGEALLYFLKLLDEPRKANPLKALRQRYYTELVTSPRVADSSALTKGDILSVDLLQYFPALSGAPCEDYVEQAEDFQREFCDAYLAIATAIDESFLKGQRGIRETPVNEWSSVTFTYRELYERNFFGVRESIEGHSSIFSDNRRALLNGVAITSSKKNHRGRGRRSDPEYRNAVSLALGVKHLSPDSKEFQKRLGQLMEDRTQIEDCYYYALGFDKAIEMIGDYVKLPDFDIFSIDAGDLADEIDELNDLVERLANEIAQCDHTDESLKQQKLWALRECLPPIRWQEIKTSEQGIEIAKEMLYDNMRAFDIADGRFLAAMTFRTRENE